MADIRPNRDNWHEFCEAEPLTNAEWRERRDRMLAIVGDEEMSARLLDATLKEVADFGNAAELRTDDWTDMVVQADATRRLWRAELEWLREHVE